MFYTITPDGRRWAYSHGVWSWISNASGEPVPCVVSSEAVEKDAARYHWLREHVVFLHQSAGERDPVHGPTREWNIQGAWTKQPNDLWFKSLDEAIDAAMLDRSSESK